MSIRKKKRSNHWCSSYDTAYADYDHNRILGKHTGSNSDWIAFADRRDSGSDHCGTLVALAGRMKEIEGGEEDEASKY